MRVCGCVGGSDMVYGCGCEGGQDENSDYTCALYIAYELFHPCFVFGITSPYSYVPICITVLSFLGFHKEKICERGYVGLSHLCLQALSKTMATYISLCR